MPDPRPLGPAEWSQIGQALVQLVLFVALAVDAAVALLLGAAILPSLVHSAEAPVDLLRLRRVLVPIGIVSVVLMLVAFGRGLALAISVLQWMYPRFII
jgi:hypothetical protein